MIRQHLMSAFAIAGLLACGVAGQAAVISWNLDNNSTVGGDGAGSLPAVSAEAGVALAGGWSNSWPDNPVTDLRDDSGTATTLDISYGSTNGTFAISGHPGVDTDLSWNKEMLTGYLNAGGGGTSSVTLTDIPYANYEVIAYFSSDNDAREGSVTNGIATYYFNTVGAASNSGSNALLLQATDAVDDATDPDANYAVFSGLSGSTQTITVDIPDFGGLAGFQVVQVPEPTSLALCALMGLTSLTFRGRAS